MQNIDVSAKNGHYNGTPIPVKEEASGSRHTEEIQEIITKVPSWILRWGITLFFGILLMAYGITVLIRYPDTIKGGLKIESYTHSQPVIADAPGQIVKVLIAKGEKVKKGQVLATVENSGNTYSLAAPIDGMAAFVSIVQPGYFLKANQEVFVIHPANQQFFGIMEIPQSVINKIKEGQKVLVNIANYPAEEYGQLKGTVSYIADEPGKDGFFTVKVTLNNKELKRPLNLKNWMVGSAEIITEDISLQSRIYKSVLKGL